MDLIKRSAELANTSLSVEFNKAAIIDKMIGDDGDNVFFTLTGLVNIQEWVHQWNVLNNCSPWHGCSMYFVGNINWKIDVKVPWGIRWDYHGDPRNYIEVITYEKTGKWQIIPNSRGYVWYWKYNLDHKGDEFTGSKMTWYYLIFPDNRCDNRGNVWGIWIWINQNSPNYEEYKKILENPVWFLDLCVAKLPWYFNIPSQYREYPTGDQLIEMLRNNLTQQRTN